MITTWWHHYWAWTGGNIGAMPAQAVIAAGAGLLLRKPIAKAWHRLVGERADLEDLHTALDEMRVHAAAARKIAADLFEHHTGERHPDAPAGRKGD